MTKKNILMSATGTRKRGYVVAAMGITSLQKIKEEKNASRKMFSSAFSIQRRWPESSFIETFGGSFFSTSGKITLVSSLKSNEGK